jgi:predicted membrane protein
MRPRPRPLAQHSFADLDVDLRHLTIDQLQTTVTVLTAFGNIDVYVPEGVNVDVSGISVIGHRRDWGRDTYRLDAPAIHLRVLGFAGTIDVWRVPQDMRDASYSDIFRQLQDHPRQLPG